MNEPCERCGASVYLLLEPGTEVILWDSNGPNDLGMGEGEPEWLETYTAHFRGRTRVAFRRHSCRTEASPQTGVFEVY
jgi:hypothetical protein